MGIDINSLNKQRSLKTDLLTKIIANEVRDMKFMLLLILKLK